ncbi:GntR family transcriptional regulator [Streptomyces sp. NPDC005303]|uniref:GntR family transcriptional regulator n=1 Tax=Streptomyces sp. NPDC005303 TaxID=3155713 RepID=UPI0033AC038C
MAPRKGEPGRFLYRELAAELLARIQSGELAPGDRLPSETELIESKGVSNSTVRSAYLLLKADGHAVSMHGKGVYVRDPKKFLRNPQRRLANAVREAGRSIQSVDLEGREPTVCVAVDFIEAPDSVAEHLGEGQVCRRSRSFSLDGMTYQLATSYIPADLAREAGVDQEDTGPGGSYQRLADVGRKPVKARERARARVVMPDEVEKLDISPGMSIVLIERVVWDQEGRAVEVNEMTLDGTKYILESEFDIP